MSEGPARFVARHVHDLIERQRLDALPDHALLRLFLGGDDDAFATLVRRHGPLVLGTCRRVLRNAHDAEDACQATFLVLARKGAMIRGGDSLAGWLHRVAVRAASRLRRDLARRTAEPLPPEVHAPEPSGDELVWREVRGVFDAEVSRLPERFRLPLVLCCLQGKTRTEAAVALGWTEGAVRGRLERGRKLLRSRFARKGLSLPAALLPLLVEQVAPATTPPAAVSPSSVSARLAEGLLRSMALARAKLAAWATAAVLVVGTSVGVGLYRPATAQPKPGDPPAPAPTTPAVPVADIEKNLDTFVLRISLAPAGEGKFDPRFRLYHVLLYVPNLRLEPPANGPDGKPIEARARISKEQAKKVVAALRENGFFGGPRPVLVDPLGGDFALLNSIEYQIPVTPNEPVLTSTPPAAGRAGPHATIALRYQGGEDPTNRETAYPWDATMLRALDAVRAAVDGEAAKALDDLLAPLADERKKWAPNPVAEDLKKLQGAWTYAPAGDRLRVEVVMAVTAKCVIEGNTIVFKPNIQPSPRLDLETIRGTFELSAGPPRRMTIKGTRDTIAKQESGTWTVLYEVTDSTLKLLLPPAGAAPPATMPSKPEKGERLFLFKRQAAGVTSEWGKPSNGVQARIRTPKAKYAAGETPTFDVDVRDTRLAVTGKPWTWRAPRDGQFARVQVDGVWYLDPVSDLKKVAHEDLGAGQTVEGWAKVELRNDTWVEDTANSGEPRRLVLKSGKHTVRVAYDFHGEIANPSARPESGPIEIEVLPATGKAEVPAAGEWRSKATWTPAGAGGVHDLAVAPDAEHVLSVDRRGLTHWDVRGPAVRLDRKTDFTVEGIEFAGLDRDGVPLLLRRTQRADPAGVIADLSVFRPSDMKEDMKAQVAVMAESLRQWAVRPDGKVLAALLGGWNDVRLIDLWTAKDRSLEVPMGDGKMLALPHQLRFSRDGKTLFGLGSNDYPVTGWRNGAIVCWDVETGKLRWVAEEADGQNAGALSADGRTLVTGGRFSKNVTLWDTNTGDKVRTLSANGVDSVAVSPDARTIVVGGRTPADPHKPELIVWDLSGNRPTATAIPASAVVTRIAFGPDGQAFATADAAGEVRWWVRGK
jgi:RNA polymerase sigma factor (sigma-70 family)